jgi:hypothetical protein
MGYITSELLIFAVSFQPSGNQPVALDFQLFRPLPSLTMAQRFQHPESIWVLGSDQTYKIASLDIPIRWVGNWESQNRSPGVSFSSIQAGITDPSRKLGAQDDSACRRLVTREFKQGQEMKQFSARGILDLIILLVCLAGARLIWHAGEQQAETRARKLRRKSPNFLIQNDSALPVISSEL